MHTVPRRLPVLAGVFPDDRLEAAVTDRVDRFVGFICHRVSPFVGVAAMPVKTHGEDAESKENCGGSARRVEAVILLALETSVRTWHHLQHAHARDERT